MKGINKVHVTGIALVVTQLMCATAYAKQEASDAAGCVPGDGNSFLSPSPHTVINTDAHKHELAVQYVKALQKGFPFTSTQAAGIVANLLWESGLNSGMKNVTGSLGEAVMQGDAVDQTGFGVAQWIGERKARLIALAAKWKIPASSHCANFNYLVGELVLDPAFQKVIPGVLAEKNLVGAVCAFEKLYQIPKIPASSNRIQLGRDIMAWLGESYVEGKGSTGGDACDFYPGPQPDGTITPPNSPVSKSYVSPGGGASPSGDYQKPPHGFANNWTTVRVSNTTNEPIRSEIVMQDNQALPPGVTPTVRLHGEFTIPAGGYVDVPFYENTAPNIKSMKGDRREHIWNQAELFFEKKTGWIWFNMSYIYGANSNVRIFCEDGRHSGYLGDIFADVPPGLRVGNWGIKRPFQNMLSDDQRDPDSATGGPYGAHNAASAYFYSKLKKGEGYVHRGKPAQVDVYDDASSLQCSGRVAVVF